MGYVTGYHGPLLSTPEATRQGSRLPGRRLRVLGLSRWPKVTGVAEMVIRVATTAGCIMTTNPSRLRGIPMSTDAFSDDCTVWARRAEQRGNTQAAQVFRNARWSAWGTPRDSFLHERDTDDE